MVKSVLGVHHQGLRDWVIQRVSACILAAYSLFLIAYFLFHPDLSYPEWHYLFAQTTMKIATILCIISLLYHAWIGVWTIFTDYIKISLLRMILNFIVLFLLVASFFWGLIIVWSV